MAWKKRKRVQAKEGYEFEREKRIIKALETKVKTRRDQAVMAACLRRDLIIRRMVTGDWRENNILELMDGSLE